MKHLAFTVASLLATLIIPATTQAQDTTPSRNAILIDKFFVPAAAKQEFLERMTYNRNYIRTLPGFLRDEIYSSTDADGNLHIVTVAVWKDQQAIDKAKIAVQAEYKRVGFDMPGMLNRLHITIDRGIYSPMTEQ